jgi:hypothetical protein
MATRTDQTFDRPKNLREPADPSKPADVLYPRSYLLTRMIIGLIGILLPIALILGEWLLLDDAGVRVRGSLSAYYHSSMRDLFVAALCVTGFFLATYMAGQSNKDFWYSLWAGLAVFGVAFLPTQRPGIPDDGPFCGATPMPEGCAPLQQAFGETPVATFHFIFAAAFIISLAVMSFFFAKREKETEETPTRVRFLFAKTSRIRLLYICFGVIVGAVVLAVVGMFVHFTVAGLTTLYIAEVASVWAFGTAWFVKSRDLWSALRHGVEVDDTREGDGKVARTPARTAP